MTITVRTRRQRRSPTSPFLEDNEIVSNLRGPRGTRRARRWEVLDGLGHTGASLRAAISTMASVNAGDPSAIARGAARHLPLRDRDQAGATTWCRAKRRCLRVVWRFPIARITSHDQHGVAAVSIDGGPAVCSSCMRDRLHGTGRDVSPKVLAAAATSSPTPPSAKDDTICTSSPAPHTLDDHCARSRPDPRTASRSTSTARPPLTGRFPETRISP